jgi:MFS family permease
MDASLDSRRAWLIAAAAASGMFAVFGVGYSFGAFFNSMSEEFETSSSATALVFSITISLSFLLGLWTGRWCDRVGPKPVMRAAAASLTIGLLLTAAVPNLWLGYVTYGGGVGFAIACAYVPMVATVGGWFERRRATALGLSVTGIGLGTLVGSPTAARLIDATSWRTTYVIFALFGGTVLMLASLVIEPGPAAVLAPKPQSLRTLLGNRDFALLYVSIIFSTLGLFVPFVFLADYAEDRGISDVKAAALVGIIGGVSVISRLGLGGLADRLGSLRLYVASFFLMAIAHWTWSIAGSSYPMLVTYAVLLGLGYGGFIALAPAVLADRFGLAGLGGMIGMLYTAAAVGAFLSPPLAGWIIDHFGYTAAVIYGATGATIGMLIVVPILWSSTHQPLPIDPVASST